MNIICKNCGSVTSGKYCSHCGQRTSINKVTFKETLQDFVDAVFSVNSPFFVTLKLLVLNPGKLFREYLNGKRKAYYKPVPFFILTTVIYILVRSLLNYDPMANMATGGGANVDQNLINEAGVFMAKNINNIIFTFVFAFALVVKMFFYKRYSLVEYLAISFYVIGFYMVITIILMFGLQFVSAQFKMLPFIIMFFYVVYALISLFQKLNILNVVKVVFVYYIALILYMILGYGMSFIIVALNTR